MYNPRGGDPSNSSAGAHFNEIMDTLKIEYDKLTSESNRYKHQRDEFERKCKIVKTPEKTTNLFFYFFFSPFISMPHSTITTYRIIYIAQICTRIREETHKFKTTVRIFEFLNLRFHINDFYFHFLRYEEDLKRFQHNMHQRPQSGLSNDPPFGMMSANAFQIILKFIFF